MKQRTVLLLLLAVAGGCSDYALNARKTMESAGTEVMDTGSAIPEEGDPDTGSAPPPEEEPEPEPDPIDHDVTLRLSADDQWEAWMDGEWVDRQEGWNLVDEYSYVLSSGTHVVAVRVDDLHRIINGFIAELTINGSVWSLTGEGLWRVTHTAPTADWTAAEHSEVDWEAPVICVDDAPWSGIPTLVNPDAEWIWHDTDCRQALGTAWFRLVFELP